jgi:hypothetical protein
MTKTWWEAPMEGLSQMTKTCSEEKIFLEINQSETRIACGGHVC